jgi:hypothetical protein
LIGPDISLLMGIAISPSGDMPKKSRPVDQARSMSTIKPDSMKLALLWPRDVPKWHAATPQEYRLNRVFEALAALGIEPEPALYADDVMDQVRAQLLACDGVLVWVDPLFTGRNRKQLDAMLRDVAAKGVWVSAHPDVILKMGAKEVLYRTRYLGWGTDTHLYRTSAVYHEEFPRRLQQGASRVVKQNRGNGGQGVWKVELISTAAQVAPMARVLQASRGSVPVDLPLDDFMTQCEGYFADGGCIIDQPFQPRLPDGMIRCYMGADKVIGFGHQLIKALIPPPAEGPNSEAAMPGPRIMHPASAPEFQTLKNLMESDWTPQMMRALDIDAGSLPIIWDADFLYGPRDGSGKDTYVLCEINVSSVFPFPEQAPAVIARLARDRSLTYRAGFAR